MSEDSTPHRDAQAEEAKPGYEAPSVEEIDTEDAAAVTAAGLLTDDDASDLRLKRSLRPLEGIDWKEAR